MRVVGFLLFLGGLALAGVFGLGIALQKGAEFALTQGGARAAAVVSEGFPTRLGLRFEAPALASEDGLSGWSAPELRLGAPVLAPLDWRADLPATQNLTLDGQRYAIDAETSVIEAGFGARAELPLTRAAIRADRIEVAPAAAPTLRQLSARALRIGLLQDFTTTGAAQASPALYRLSASAEAIDLSPDVAALLVAQGIDLPAGIEDLVIEADLGLTQPLDRNTAPETLALDRIDIAEARLDWGGRRIAVSGPLARDAQGLPEGTLMITLPDWRDWIALARETGLLPENRVPMVTVIATQLAAQSPDGVLRLPLNFARGQMALGPIPLGPIPTLR